MHIVRCDTGSKACEVATFSFKYRNSLLEHHILQLSRRLLQIVFCVSMYMCVQCGIGLKYRKLIISKDTISDTQKKYSQDYKLDYIAFFMISSLYESFIKMSFFTNNIQDIAIRIYSIFKFAIKIYFRDFVIRDFVPLSILPRYTYLYQTCFFSLCAIPQQQSI